MGGPKARKHYAVEERLPKEVRAQIDRMILEGVTFDELKAYSDSLGYDISRSAFGRYGKDFLEIVREVRIVEDKSRAIISEAGDGLVLDEAAAKLLTAAALKQAQGNLDLKALLGLMHALANLQGSNIQREKLKAVLKQEMEKRAAKAADKVAEKAKKAGLSPKTVNELRAEILGIPNV